jgi:hypothetical protein
MIHPRHCEERSDEAIHLRCELVLDCFAALAKTVSSSRCVPNIKP